MKQDMVLQISIVVWMSYYLKKSKPMHEMF